MKKILVLHGALGDSLQMENITNALSQYGEVKTLDFPGHGTNTSEMDFSIENCSTHLLNWIESNDWTGCEVFGYSMGGYVALHLESEHPSTFSRIITLGTKYLWNPEIVAKETAMLNPEVINEKVPKFANVLSQRHSGIGWQKVCKKTASLMKRLGEKPLLNHETLQKVNIEAVVTLGDRDEMVSLEETRTLYKALPNSSMVMWPNTKHPIERFNAEYFTLIF